MVEPTAREIASLLWPTSNYGCAWSGIAGVFRHQHPAMAKLEVPQIPAWGESNRARVEAFLPLLDAHLADRPFICGEHFTLADITGLIAIDFMKPAKLSVPEGLSNIRRWHADLSARPSARA